MAILFAVESNTSHTYHIDNVQIGTAGTLCPRILDQTLEDFQTNRNITYNSSTGVYTAQVANPSATGVNTSAQVGRYVRNSGELYDVLFYKDVAINNVENFRNGKSAFKLQVYSSAPVGTMISLQLETSASVPSNYPTGRHSLYQVATTKQNQWETLEFSFVSRLDALAEDADVNNMVILFSPNSNNGSTYYIDNLITEAENCSDVSDNLAPSIPSNLASPSKTANSVSLTWSASTDNVEVAGYEVFVGSEPTPRATVTGTGTSATIGSLSASTPYSFKVRARDAANNFSGFSSSISVTTNADSPTGHPIPGTIQGEDYCAMNGVQEEGTQDGGPGENVGWIDAGDWMEYCVNVAASGSYNVGFRVASQSGGGQFQLRNEAGASLATVNVAATGGWQVWTTLNANVTLAAGAQKIRIHAIAGGFNLNWMQFSTSGDTQAPTAPSNLASPSKTTNSVNLTWSASTDNVEVTGYEVYVGTESTPRATVTGTSATIGSLSAGATYSFKVRAKDLANNFSGYSASLSVTTNTDTPTGQPIPGTIQAESYTAMSGVQKETTQDGGPGENVGYIESGDWMEYDVNVASAGSYSVGFRVASEPGGGQFQLRNAAGTSLATINIGATGGWQVWTTLNANVSLSAGAQKIRIHATAPGFNVNWMTFTTACNPTAITPHLSVNGGAWQQTSTATLTAGGSVIFGPQPGTGGSWSWTGPNGFTATTREVTRSNMQTNQSGNYVATHTNSCGATSTQTFTITVNANNSFTQVIEAENYIAMSGVITETCSEGGSNIGSFDGGDWTAYNVNIPTTGTYKVSYRVASIYSGKTLRLEKDAGATQLGSVTIPNTGSWQIWTTVSHNVSLPAGQYAIGLASSTGGLNINRITITNNLAARLGADEESEAASTNLVLYPNPVESDLFFTEIPEGAKVVVRNLRGEQVLKGSVEDKSINLSALKSGLYIIFINDGKTIKAKQIIKK